MENKLREPFGPKNLRKARANEKKKPEAAAFFKAVDAWVAQVRADWKVMRARHVSRGRPGLPSYTWDNKGPISTKWFDLCDCADKLWETWRPKDSKNVPVMRDTFLHIVLDYCVELTSFTDGGMKKEKLLVKVKDWKNGEAYRREIKGTLERQADPENRGIKTAEQAPRAKKPRVEAPVVETVTPPAHDYLDRSRVALRMRLYDHLIGKEDLVPTTPYSPADAAREGGARDAVGVHLIDVRHVPGTASEITKKGEDWEVEKKQSAMTKYGAWEWAVRGDPSMSVADDVLVELKALGTEVAPEDWSKWMTYPAPKEREYQQDDEEADDLLDDDSSVNSSEPEPDYQWEAEHIPAVHPLNGLINTHPPDPLPTLTATRLEAARLSITPPQWNAYLLASGIEEALFKAKGGKTEAYHAHVKAIRGELKNRSSSLRARLLRHLTAPEKLPQLTTHEISSRFHRSAVV